MLAFSALIFCLVMAVSCHGSYLDDKFYEQQLLSMLPTFNSLWETNYHYIEAKKELLLGGVDKMKSNVSIDSASQELDGYVYFQFIHKLMSFGTHPAQSYLTFGVSTEVCHLDIDGRISYKLSLVEEELRNNDDLPGDDYVILLKMYTDSQCSEEFGKYLLPSFDTVEELEMYDNQLLITTSTLKEGPNLPVRVVGTWLSVMPQDNEKLQYTVPPYIFAVGNNADIFEKVVAKAGDLLSLSMQCFGQSSITFTKTVTTFEGFKPTVISSSTANLDQFVFTTIPSLQIANNEPNILISELSTEVLFTSLLQYVKDPTIGTKRQNTAEGRNVVKCGHLRGSQQLISDNSSANYTDQSNDEYGYCNCFTHDDKYANAFDVSYDDDKNIGDDYDKNIRDDHDKNIGDDYDYDKNNSEKNVTAGSVYDSVDYICDVGDTDVGDGDVKVALNIKQKVEPTTMEWVVSVKCLEKQL